MKTLLTSEFRSSALYWAVNRIIAELTPQSLNIIIMFGAIRTMPYSPYRSGPSSSGLAMRMVPIYEMPVESTSPQSR